MSELIRLSNKRQNDTFKAPYKTILNNRELTEYKSCNKQTKNLNLEEKALQSQQNFLLEKRINKITATKSNTRSSSAIKKRRSSQNVLKKTTAGLKYKNLLAPTNDLINTLLFKNKDERYRYLIRNAKVHYIEKGTESIYVELPQIPNILIIYRRPEVRLKSKDSLILDDRGLSHIPLLEGEEKLTKLVLKRNRISRIENLVSLPYLEYLDIGKYKGF